MTKANHLFRPIFLISVFLLIVNDLFLKYQYHNYLTGKLSDFAGLFAFPYFLSYFLKKRIKYVYFITGIIFIFWKSDLSQPIFDYFHNLGIGINRTVDYMDLMALIILPLSYRYYTHPYFSIVHRSTRVLKPLVMGICIFSFVATTLPKQIGELKMGSELKTDLKMDIEKAKRSLGVNESAQEDKYIYRISIPGKKASIATLVEFGKKENGLTEIKLDSILNYEIEGSSFIFSSGIDEQDIEYIENLSQPQIEELFLNQVGKQTEQK